MHERPDRPSSRSSSAMHATVAGGRYPVSQEVSVQWGDMDVLGHVNNTRYFRWLEEARVAYLRLIGVEIARDAAIAPVLASASVDFVRPVTWPDKVLVECKVTRLGRSSLTMGYRLTSLGQQTLVATGTSVVVLIAPSTGRSAVIPDACRDTIKRMDPDVKEAG